MGPVAQGARMLRAPGETVNLCWVKAEFRTIAMDQ
ncbi:hypothetical protein CHELA40_15402 [Chelatococcus asaccharovorans]|nr:hypothetical protein CHELA17_60214 [Chelatococcus asaccharovorans]CAH1682407.1 hypothetical protein CHELA40_15402 [Chelatococcus asaccharovorans]